MSSDPIPIKIVAVGDGMVGKTCVLISYTQNQFPKTYVPTIFQNYSAHVKVDQKLVNLGIWDTAGQQQYNKLRVLAYTHCDVFLIIFSVTDQDSFVNARKKWLPQLQQVAPNSLKIFVGNKIDLRNQSSGHIKKQIARQIIEKQTNCKYYECSALTQQGLRNVFDQAIRSVLLKKKKPGKSGSGSGGNGCHLI